MAASSFPLAELYTLLSYIYFYTSCRRDPLLLSIIFRSLLYAVCISATLPSIRPYHHGKYYLLSRPSTFTHWLLTACFFLLIHLYTIPFLMIWTDVDVHY